MSGIGLGLPKPRDHSHCCNAKRQEVYPGFSLDLALKLPPVLPTVKPNRKPVARDPGRYSVWGPYLSNTEKSGGRDC